MSTPNNQTPKKPQRRFQFIDNSNVGDTGANSTQVRRHVMQEYMREKRWESRARAEEETCHSSSHVYTHAHHPYPISRPPKTAARPRTRRKPTGNAGNATPAPQSVNWFQSRPLQHLEYHLQSGYQYGIPARPTHQVRDDVTEDVHGIFLPTILTKQHYPRRGFYLNPQAFAAIADIGDVSLPTPTSTIESGTSLSPPPPAFNTFPEHTLSRCRSDSQSPKPTSWLSAARTDPFDCLPMKLNKQDQELFDFYATVMPACSYGFERRSPRAHNWYLSVFIPEAMKSPVAFQNTILVHAANTQACVRGLLETPLAIEHRARALKMLSEQFQKYPYDTSDAAISSTISAAALEDFDPRTERRKYAWMHWNIAVQKIRDRGGPIVLEQEKSLRMLINWSDYIFSGYNGQGPTFFFDHIHSPGRYGPAEAVAIGKSELVQQCDEFLIFLKCAESMAVVAANVQNNPMARKGQPLRHTMFQPGKPLYNLLASPSGPRYTKTDQLKQIISRLAALMTINVAIWEYRLDTRVSEEFLAELIDNVKHNDLDLHISVEALLQILLSGSENPKLIHTERPWLVGRLLKVSKRLSRFSWERLNDFLLLCLDPGPFFKPVVEEWKDKLRAEVLSAPLVSYVLPLMQP